MTTPKEAREQVTGMYTVNGREFTRLVYDLCDQVEALTAEITGYKADAARYKALMRIAYSDSPQKHLIEVTMDQSKLDAAIAKGTA